MKKILFIRHAKSDWSDQGLSDFERPLNKRGKKDAPEMGKRLFKAGVNPDLFLVSTSKRTRQTIKLLAEKAKWELSKLEYFHDLYLPSIADFMLAIEEVNDRHEFICFCSHNPGTTEIVNYLSSSSIDNIPTCGVALIEFPGETWKEISGGTGQVTHYDYPKKD